MRRFLAAVVGVVLLTITGLAPVRSADADTTAIGTVHASEVAGGGYLISVWVPTASNITQVTARIRKEGETAVVATVDDFATIPSTVVWRKWTSVHPLALAVGRYSIDVTVQGADGVIEEKANAGVIINRIKVRFAEASVSPTTVDIEHDTVTWTGRLVYTAADGSEWGLSGVNVHAGDVYRPEPTADGLTDSEGRFSLTYSLRGANTLAVWYAGDTIYRSATVPSVQITYRTLATRITLSLTSKNPVVGEKATFKGLLERQNSSGVWTGFTDRTVSIFFWNIDAQSDSKIATVRTGADGSFSGSFPVPGSGSWTVRYNHPSEQLDFGYAQAGASTGTNYAQYRTAVTGLDVGPEPVGKGTKVTARGHVGRLNATGGQAVVKSGLVELAFSPDGKDWSFSGSLPNARTNQNGDFVISATAVRDGYWRALYFGDSANSSNITTDMFGVSNVDYVDVRYRTAISSFNASPEPVRRGRTLTVSGKLSRYVNSWGAFAGQKVYVYFQPRGSTTQAYVGVTTTNGTGNFRKGFKAAKDGTWRVVFKQTSQYLSVTSGGDYVDVR